MSMDTPKATRQYVSKAIAAARADMACVEHLILRPKDSISYSSKDHYSQSW